MAFVSCFGFLAARYVGSLAPWPGMEPALPVLKGSLKHWTTREVLSSGFFKKGAQKRKRHGKLACRWELWAIAWNREETEKWRLVPSVYWRWPRQALDRTLVAWDQPQSLLHHGHWRTPGSRVLQLRSPPISPSKSYLTSTLLLRTDMNQKKVNSLSRLISLCLTSYLDNPPPRIPLENTLSALLTKNT